MSDNVQPAKRKPGASSRGKYAVILETQDDDNDDDGGGGGRVSISNADDDSERVVPLSKGAAAVMADVAPDISTCAQRWYRELKVIVSFGWVNSLNTVRHTRLSRAGGVGRRRGEGRSGPVVATRFQTVRHVLIGTA